MICSWAENDRNEWEWELKSSENGVEIVAFGWVVLTMTS